MATLTSRISNETVVLVSVDGVVTDMIKTVVTDWLDENGVPQATTSDQFSVWTDLPDIQKTMAQDFHEMTVPLVKVLP